MTDEELLKAAAKAAGLEPFTAWGKTFVMGDGSPPRVEWNPLEDDGDALRLAVKLRMHVQSWGSGAAAVVSIDNRALVAEPHYGDDPERATRRAIVRAAAALA